VEAGDVRGFGGTDADGGEGRELGLAAEQDLYAVGDGGGKGRAGDELGGGGGWGLSMATEGSEACGEGECGQTAGDKHNPLIIAEGEG